MYLLYKLPLRKINAKVVYISNSRDYTEQNDVNDNKYLAHINKLLEDD